VIRAYRDGPLLVRGPVVLEDEEAVPVDVRRAVIALCRCGRSRNAPLCDGSHVRYRRSNGASLAP
jgi:CDGSH-type Zn-finger protein